MILTQPIMEQRLVSAEMESPTLLAKKQARDAKRKKLEAAFKQMASPLVADDVGNSGESSSESLIASNNYNPEASVYLQNSYQNNHLGDDCNKQLSADVEHGIAQQGSTSIIYQATNSLSLREEVQSLIDNGSEDDRICVDPQKAFLENLGSSPQRVLMSILLIVFLWWLL